MFRARRFVMLTRSFSLLLLSSAVLLLISLTASFVRAADSAEVRRLFADPPREYSTGPLWVWNDMLTEQQIRDTLRDLAGQKVKQVWVHPRPGLMTPYLSEDWFRLWKVSLDEAERLDMNVWIYDENSYPSGFAGGLVPEAMPESRGRGLAISEQKKPPKWSDEIIAVHRLTGEGYENVTAAVRDGTALPEGRYLVSKLRRAGSSPWFGGKFYVDLLYPGVTEKFIEVTLEPYRREIGDAFGKRVPGVFTDEPHLRPAGQPWTEHLPQIFKRRWGYSLIDNLPALVRPVGDWKRVRYNYFQLLTEQFVERWGKPMYAWCEKNGLEFTGHYWEHSWPRCDGVPDNMAMYAWHQRPAIDTLMNQYREDTHAQFGNVRAVLELASVANQLGRSRTLCEAYGAGGWDLRFEDMKRIGDWLYVLGVNTLNEHLSYITIRGARKRDHPQSFSYHEPWWEAYHLNATYFTRLSLALSSGQQANDVLLIEPTTTAWMYHNDPSHRKRLDEIGQQFQSVVVKLAKAQVEFDIGCEDIIARHGSVSTKGLTVGQRTYRTVVLGPLTENLNAKTMGLLDAYLAKGGTVLCAGEPPALLDGRASDRGAAASREKDWKRVKPEELPGLLLARAGDGFVLRRDDGDKGILFHHRRQLDDGQVLFLVNTSIESPCRGTLEAAVGGIERWNLQTGRVDAYPFEKAGQGRINARFALPPSGSLLLFLSNERRPAVPQAADTVTVVKPVDAGDVRRLEPNVLVLDYVDITAGGETKKDIYFYKASQFAFKKNGMERNPWDSAVQFRDELITKTFPDSSGFEAVYRFTIKGTPPSELWAVIERPDLYRITCNGKPVLAEAGTWWLDKAFGKIDISGAARSGENTLTIKAAPFTIYHELESAYILGPFALEPTDKGFAITTDRPLTPGPWNEQGHPFYSAGVGYRQTFDLAAPAGRYRVSLGKWYGSVAKVVVNGKVAGYIAYPPWELDVAEHVKAGRNVVDVVAIGTLKNTLGPHHGKPPLGSAWPAMFHKGPTPGPPPGKGYSTVGYGLFEPFVIKQVTGSRR